MGLYCPCPSKVVFYSYRDAKRAARRITSQSGRQMAAYPCGDHIHLTTTSSAPSPEPAGGQEYRRRSRYLNHTRAFRGVA